jgi:predicted GNAT family acetyltransferase
MDIQVAIAEANHVFFANIDGKEAFLQYQVIDPQTWDYVHTFVPKALRGQGIAAQIIKYALDYARQHHIKVKPSCPSVLKFLETHKEYNDILV